MEETRCWRSNAIARALQTDSQQEAKGKPSRYVKIVQPMLQMLRNLCSHLRCSCQTYQTYLALKSQARGLLPALWATTAPAASEMKSSQPKAGPRVNEEGTLLHYDVLYYFYIVNVFFEFLWYSLHVCIIFWHSWCYVIIFYHVVVILPHHTSNPALYELQNVAWQQSCCVVV